jgi:hypothetical protein
LTSADQARWLAQLAGGLCLGALALWLSAGGASAVAAASEHEPRRPAVEAPVDPVVRYDIEASLDPLEHRIDGRATVSWRNTSSKAQRELYLHLYLNAFDSPESVFARARVGSGFRGGSVPARAGSIEVRRLHARELDVDLWKGVEFPTAGDETDVRVPLPRAVEPGETLTLEVEWVSTLPSILLRTGYSESFHMVAQWYPKLARLEPDGRWAHFPFHRLGEFYADFGDYELAIDLPERFVVGATGKRSGEPERRDGRMRHRYRATRVHDVAFAAWDGFAELSATSPSGVALRCLYPPEEEEAARRELDVAARGLELLSRLYGDYPYDTLTIVHPPWHADGAGGMEYPTLITTGGAWRLSTLGVRYLELVTMHELAHQWFYGLVASNEDRWPFLDEGLAHWAALDALEQWYPGSSAFERFGLEADTFSFMRLEAVKAADRGAIARGAEAFASGADYSALVYSRAATLLETIARVHGRDALRGALGRYARAHRFGHPDPDDLLRAIGEGLGAEVADTTREALMAAGRVDYAVDQLVPDRLGDEPAWVRVRRHGTLRFPVDVDLHDESGSVERLRWDAAGDHALFDHAGPGRLVAVVIDPETRVLLDEDLSNNAQRASRARLAPRVLTHAAFAAALLLAVLAP